MIKTVNYDTVLCSSRHNVFNSRGEVIDQAIFPEVCKLNVKYLDDKSSTFLLKYSKLAQECKQDEVITLNVYITGFSPALISFINMKQKYAKELQVVFWHYDNNTQAYTPQVLL